MNSHFFTAPFYFAFIWFKVQGSRFKVQGSRGDFAAIICGAMPDQESFSPLPLEGADERSEAGLASPPRFESQPPPLRGTSFQRQEGEKRSVLTGN